jgi:hypothetical protein
LTHGVTDAADFTAVLLQLVISVVGGVPMRQALLNNAAAHMEPHGVLMLSACGASEDINDECVRAISVWLREFLLLFFWSCSLFSIASSVPKPFPSHCQQQRLF